MGCFTGFIIYITSGGTNSHILQFNEELFFIYLLPPIIFNAGFQVKKKHFFQNFVAIMMFGVVGVFISTAIIATGCRYLFPRFHLKSLTMQDYLAIGTIFSATDSVCTLQVLNQDETPLLYSLVFGEGVVNDATTVVLFRAVQKFGFDQMNISTAWRILLDFLYLFSTSTILGVIIGLLSAYIIKTLYFGRHSTDREISLMALMAYLSYMLAELFYLSGILTVFFCGIVMSHYTWHNVTESSRVTSRHTFATMSFIAETFIFLYVGMDVLDVDKWKLAKRSAVWPISGILIFLTLVGRAAFAFPLSAILNHVRRTPATHINCRRQIIIWWAGLMRGAVSIALAFQQFTSFGDTRNPDYATMICSTVTVVVFTTVVFGLLSKPLIKCLLPEHLRILHGSNSDPSSPKELRPVDLEISLLSGQTGGSSLLRRSSLSMLLQDPTAAVHDLWRKFDDCYMRPIFGGRGFAQNCPGSPR
ncbi:hypothetical protein O6H91_03G052100 [Diphasiastrum complanatum]|uniref:Uncharacterized protein n=3 Tax=Diphasiastrum complanatum TaxID=34168 RepID=A0ACC2E6K2_DIPCM|nr:hypothetical protein O6H91_03G052100 [Diphasiastrum complanatum]KAJ7562012.1 hypothetical protein O6H91_03G052100 [Diphasiastrum complanatum]KAJ7562013.1 hypothetical protein O6H91_03G052100 [Diphasiastrum complanatum]